MFGKTTPAARSPRLLLLLAPVLLSAGCGSKGTVSGKVFNHDKALTGGIVTFVAADGSGSFSAPIGEDGGYTISKVPPGPVKIAVFPPAPEAKEPTKPPADMPEQAAKMFASREAAKKGGPASPNFSDANKSGITYTVTSGSQNFDIQLK